MLLRENLEAPKVPNINVKAFRSGLTTDFAEDKKRRVKYVTRDEVIEVTKKYLLDMLKQQKVAHVVFGLPAESDFNRMREEKWILNKYLEEVK